jgi:hypothetical protein
MTRRHVLLCLKSVENADHTCMLRVNTDVIVVTRFDFPTSPALPLLNPKLHTHKYCQAYNRYSHLHNGNKCAHADQSAASTLGSRHAWRGSVRHKDGSFYMQPQLTLWL